MSDVLEQPNFKWTEAAVSSLQALWEQGISARVIAAKLGCTRCAALGKLHRMATGERDKTPATPNSFSYKRPRMMVSDAHVEAIIEGTKQGQTSHQLAQSLGLYYEQVAYVRKKTGVTKLKRPPVDRVVRPSRPKRVKAETVAETVDGAGLEQARSHNAAISHFEEGYLAQHGRLDFAQLQPHHGCRYLIDQRQGPAKYCGQQGYPWCDHHGARVHGVVAVRTGGFFRLGPNPNTQKQVTA